MPHYEQQYYPNFPDNPTASCGQGHCWCNCVNYQTYESSQLTPVPELSCRHEGGQSVECQGKCQNWCLTYDHMHNISQPPRPARPRQPYTPGRRGRGRGASKSNMRRGYNKGGKANPNNKSRFSGRTQNNPKGKPTKR